MILAEIGVYYFICIFVYYQNDVAQVYADLSDFSKFGKPPHFDRRTKRLEFLSRIYKTFIDFVIINMTLLPPIFDGYCVEQSRHKSFKEVCGLLATTWMPFDISQFLVKQIFLLWQSYSALLTLKGAALISFAIMESIEHLVIRIQHLKMMLEAAINTDDDAMRRKRFNKCIQYHQEIFRIGKKMDEYYTLCLFLHILLSGALFGIIGYRFIKSSSYNTLFLFAGWLLSLYIVCISGQHLINEALSVGEVAYNSKWYNRDVRFQKKILFIMVRSQRPLVVHTGPFSYVSHVLILTILKTAYSYTTLLNAASS